MTDKTNEVEALIDKAAKADKSDDALKFSQAACNAANAMCAAKSALLMKGGAPELLETVIDIRNQVHRIVKGGGPADWHKWLADLDATIAKSA